MSKSKKKDYILVDSKLRKIINQYLVPMVKTEINNLTPKNSRCIKYNNRCSQYNNILFINQ